MKTTVLLLLCSCILGPFSQAQSSKIAYVNIQAIHSQWTDYKSADQTLASLRKQQQQEYHTKAKSAHDKALQLAAAQDTLVSKQNNETRKRLKTELSQISKQVQAFELEMQLTYLNKEKELKTPLQALVQQAIHTVAVEKNYTGVTDVSQMTYYQKADDITSAVLLKLGVNNR
jgi:Skp family chaperone for outer membrane proteins